MAGKLASETVTELTDDEGLNFMQAAARAGYAQSSNADAVIKSAQTATSSIDYFVELHIEQGARVASICFMLDDCSCICKWVGAEGTVLQVLRRDGIGAQRLTRVSLRIREHTI